MADFGVDLGVAFKRGSSRGARSQLSSMGIDRENLMRRVGDCLIAYILAHRKAFEERCAEQARSGNSELHAAFQIARADSDPKSRWVDGTPEYSMGIPALRKLFPDARFIHLLRKVDDVGPFDAPVRPARRNETGG